MEAAAAARCRHGASRWPFSRCLLAFVALLVRCTSPGPVLFAQTRVSHHGRPFRCLKFRTMRVGADAELTALLESDSGKNRLCG